MRAVSVCMALCALQPAHGQASDAPAAPGSPRGVGQQAEASALSTRPMDAAMSELLACYERSFARLGMKTTDIGTLGLVSADCFRESGYAYELTEWEVRRGAFQQAQTQSDEILRLVERMTWGGILLAGLQLTFVFALSWRERKLLVDATELRAESNKLYFKSSVAGLAILVITFAFFYLYIRYVYPVTVQSSASGSAAQQAEMGRLDTGSAPAESAMGRLDEPGSRTGGSPAMGRLDDPAAAPGPAASAARPSGPPQKAGLKHRASQHVNAARTNGPCMKPRQVQAQD